MTDDWRNQFHIVNLNRDKTLLDMASETFFVDRIPAAGVHVNHLVLSLGGNYHNVFGMIENPVPFRVGVPVVGSVPLEDARIFLPRDLVFAQFAIRFEKLFRLGNVIRRHYSDATLTYLCPPPPIGDETHLRANPGVFAEFLHLGFAPRELRLALYRIQVEVMMGYAHKQGACFLPPPPATVDVHGFLMRDFYNNDPTHGNGSYGALVLQQLIDLTEG